MLTITQEQWNTIHDDYKGEWMDYHGDKPEWIGRKVVMSTCITGDPTEKCTLLVEGVHFIILPPQPLLGDLSASVPNHQTFNLTKENTP